MCTEAYRRNNGQGKGEGEWEGEGEREDVGLHYEEQVAGLGDAEGEWEGQCSSYYTAAEEAGEGFQQCPDR